MQVLKWGQNMKKLFCCVALELLNNVFWLYEDKVLQLMSAEASLERFGKKYIAFVKWRLCNHCIKNKWTLWRSMPVNSGNHQVTGKMLGAQMIRRFGLIDKWEMVSLFLLFKLCTKTFTCNVWSSLMSLLLEMLLHICYQVVATWL